MKYAAAIFSALLLSPTAFGQGTSTTTLWLILGDSFSAGNGAGDYAGLEGCFRSTKVWGALAASVLSDRYDIRYTNRACSGAKVADLEAAQFLGLIDEENFVDDGTGGLVCPNADTEEGEIVFGSTESGELVCGRFVQPQLDVVDDTIDVVLLTLGANDIGYNDLIGQCFIYPLRDAPTCLQVIQDGSNYLSSVLGTDLTNALIAIANKLGPDGKIILLSYPHAIREAPPFILDDGPLDVTTLVRDLATQGETVQRQSVADANQALGREVVIFYEETKSLFEDHEPHPDLSNSDNWFVEACTTGLFFAGCSKDANVNSQWYHPNEIGHDMLSKAFATFYRTIFPSTGPSVPSSSPSEQHSATPSTGPSVSSSSPSEQHSATPSTGPSVPSSSPSEQHSATPFTGPSVPSSSPSEQHSATPSTGPSVPSSSPSEQHSATPSTSLPAVPTYNCPGRRRSLFGSSGGDRSHVGPCGK